MKVFVTGGSGFVGGATIDRLLRDGHDVRAMSRSERSDPVLFARGAEPVRCALDSVTASDFGDAEVIIHCAAYVEAWGPPDAWYRVNVLGTKRLLGAAKAAGVRRFIHIGSEAAIVFGQHVVGADETVPLAPHSPYPYCATKAKAEALVRDANATEFETLVLRPRFVWGPGDTTLLPELERLSAGGRWSWIDHGRARTSTTHIANLVHAVSLALTAGRGGGVYFVLDDGETTMKTMLTGMAASRNIELADRSIPYWLAASVAWSAEKTWRLFRLGGAPPLTRHAAMVMARDCVLVGERAKAELGYTPIVSREEGLRALSDSAVGDA